MGKEPCLKEWSPVTLENEFFRVLEKAETGKKMCVSALVATV